MKKLPFILFTLLIGMLLTVLPLPPLWAWYRPQWILLTLISWIWITRGQVNVGFAFFVGLYMDLLTGEVLGQHAVAYVIVTYLAILFSRKIQLTSLFEQLFFILILSFFYQLINFCLLGLLINMPNNYQYWFPVLTNVIIWPLYYIWIQIYRRTVRIDRRHFATEE